MQSLNADTSPSTSVSDVTAVDKQTVTSLEREEQLYPVIPEDVVAVTDSVLLQDGVILQELKNL